MSLGLSLFGIHYVLTAPQDFYRWLYGTILGAVYMGGEPAR